MGILAFREFYLINIQAYVGAQNILDSKRFWAFVFVAFLAIGATISLLLGIVKKKTARIPKPFENLPVWVKVIISISLITLPGLIKWVFPLPNDFTYGYWMEFLSMFIIAVMIQSVSFRDESDPRKLLIIGSGILLAGTAHAILYKFSQVTNYPFTLYWSEGNRFFDYSVLFGKSRYLLASGEKINAFTSWGMQLPWAIPFVFPALTIGFFRFWYQLMWILPTFILGIAALTQIDKNRSSLIITVVFASWAFLFLDQGPIYAPLILGTILTVIAARMKMLPGVALIMVASYYTRSARWTWSYAPGLWAGLLALLAIEKPSFNKQGFRSLIKPAALGLAGYLGGQLIPSIIRSATSNADLLLLPNPIASTSRQPLLWERFLPNPTYPPGIFWALLWAALPVVLVIVVMIIKKEWKINWLQKLALLTVPGTFLVVGIIASVKIGGGSNLHNLDMFLISLVLISASLFSKTLREEDTTLTFSSITIVFIFIALISPTTFTLLGGSRLSLPANELSSEALVAVKKEVAEYSRKGEVLFIDHRQLLTFNQVESVPLVDQYEKKYLMDQAMADNEKYFNAFYKDLANKRFALIVNEPSNLVIRGSEYSFGEENDAYVKWVTIPLLCAYEPIYTSPQTSLELLVPRTTSIPDSLNCDMILPALK